MDHAAFTHLPPMPGFSLPSSSGPSTRNEPSCQGSSGTGADGAALAASSSSIAPLLPAASTSAPAPALAPGTRPARSRRDRPCDSCRTSKRRCFKSADEPCVACQAAGSACTFLEPPHKRVRAAVGADGGENAAPSLERHKSSGGGAAQGKGRKRPAEEIDRILPEEDNDEDGALEQERTSAGPGPKTQRMALEQVLNMTGAAVGASAGGDSGLQSDGGAVDPQAIINGHVIEGPEVPRILVPTYQPTRHEQGPLARILNRARMGAPDYDQSERSTSHQESSLRSGQSPSPEESDLAHPGLDHSRFAASEPHFSGASAAEDPSLNFMTSRVREVTSTQGAGSANKIFFVQAPSLVYQKLRPGPPGSDSSYGIAPLIRALELLGRDDPQVLLETFINITLPAIPVLNLVRFQHHLRAYPMSEQLYPSRILTGILAHAIMYNPDLRAKQGQVWIEVYDTLTHEFLQPRLQTIQLTLLDLISRPDKNPGGNSIALARAVGAAQLLGLHLDCSGWELPRWEKNLRKRLFWLMFVMDKWASLYQGRPPHIHSSQYNVPFMTLDDFDSPVSPTTPASTASSSRPISPASSQHNGATMSQAAIDSAHSFIALTKLSVIVEELSEEFFSVKAQNLGGASSRIRASRAGRQQKLRVIETFGADLDRFERELPDRLKIGYQHPPGESPATGIKSMQLSYLGLAVVLGRLAADLYDVLDEEGDFEPPLTTALDLTENVIHFLELLTPTDLSSAFWISFTPYHLSNTMSLLIRALLACRRIGHAPLLVRSIGLLRRFIVILVAHHRAPHCWDLAERSLAKLLSLMPSVSRLCPEVGHIWAEHAEEIWAQMRASPTAEVLISSIPNSNVPPMPPPGHASTSVPLPPQAAGTTSTTMRPPSRPGSYDALPGRDLPSTSAATRQSAPRPMFDKPEAVEQYFSSVLQNPLAYNALHDQGISPFPPVALSVPSITQASHQLGVPSDRAFPPTDELSFETPFEIAVGEEDLWAGQGNIEGYDWMGLGFEEGSPSG